MDGALDTFVNIGLCTSRRSAAGLLICRCPIPVDFIVSNRIVSLPAAIVGITLHGVDDIVLHFLNDAHMVGYRCDCQTSVHPPGYSIPGRHSSQTTPPQKVFHPQCAQFGQT